LLNDPRYEPACTFFINDIYSARDYAQRNYDLTRLHDALRRWLPERMVRPLARAVALHELTEKLDLQLLDVLVNDLGMRAGLTVELYAEAYRRCSNYDVRVQQIEWIVDIGHGVEGLINIPFSANVLKLARGPAARGGWGELMSFLERGYAAFKHMHGAAHFLNTIHERELRILNRIYAGNPDPFSLDSSTSQRLR
jgi:hypothetical protein